MYLEDVVLVEVLKVVHLHLCRDWCMRASQRLHYQKPKERIRGSMACKPMPRVARDRTVNPDNRNNHKHRWDFTVV